MKRTQKCHTVSGRQAPQSSGCCNNSAAGLCGQLTRRLGHDIGAQLHRDAASGLATDGDV
jgi:hypothetical protein